MMNRSFWEFKHFMSVDSSYNPNLYEETMGKIKNHYCDKTKKVAEALERKIEKFSEQKTKQDLEKARGLKFIHMRKIEDTRRITTKRARKRISQGSQIINEEYYSDSTDLYS